MSGFGFNTPFAEQLAFFRAKLNLPTEHWNDIERGAHDRAFIVAKAAKADLLADLHQAVARAIEEGRGIEVFRKDFAAIVEKHGWTGWKGADSKGGRAWRTRVIYQTNLATSYAAGRYKQLTDPGFVKLRPWWRYVHADGVMHPRPQHAAWGAARLTLRHDDPFWQTHFPPNGWGCQCRVVPVDAPEAGDATTPPDGWNERTDKGRLPGIDEGFDYQPGATTDTALRQMVADKLIKYPEAITRALSHDVNRYIDAHGGVEDFARAVLADRQLTHDAWLGFPENFERIKQETWHDVRGYIGILSADAPRHIERSHGHDGNGQRPPRPKDYSQVWQVLQTADTIKPGDEAGRHGLATIVASKTVEGEVWRVVFEIRPGRRTRLLALKSLVIKTP